MVKAFEKVKEDTKISEELNAIESDEECEEAFRILRPGLPFKLKEVLN